MGDVNAENLRYLNHFFETDRAQSTKELYAILKRYQGIPWVNTIASDKRGRALYADVGAIPAVPDSKTASCATALGAVTNNLLGLPVLDGSRSECDWDEDPDAVVPGTVRPRRTSPTSSATTTSPTRMTATGSPTPRSRSRASPGSSATSAPRARCARGWA